MELSQETTVRAGGTVVAVFPSLAEGERVEVIVRSNGTKGGAPPTTARGGFGFARGKIEMRDDFDAPLDDFKDYM